MFISFFASIMPHHDGDGSRLPIPPEDDESTVPEAAAHVRVSSLNTVTSQIPESPPCKSTNEITLC